MAGGSSSTPSSTGIAFSNVVGDDLAECIRLEMDVKWDASGMKACLFADARDVTDYEAHIRGAFSELFERSVKDDLEDDSVRLVKAVQGGRIVGFLHASEMCESIVEEVAHRRAWPERGSLPATSLAKPVDQLTPLDRLNIRKWALDEDLWGEQVEFGNEMIRSKKASSPFYNVETVAIASDKQGQGIGKDLIDHLQQHADEDKIGMITFCRRDVGQFYEKCGFELVEAKQMKCGMEMSCLWRPVGGLQK